MSCTSRVADLRSRSSLRRALARRVHTSAAPVVPGHGCVRRIALTPTPTLPPTLTLTLTQVRTYVVNGSVLRALMHNEVNRIGVYKKYEFMLTNAALHSSSLPIAAIDAEAHLAHVKVCVQRLALQLGAQLPSLGDAQRNAVRDSAVADDVLQWCYDVWPPACAHQLEQTHLTCAAHSQTLLSLSGGVQAIQGWRRRHRCGCAPAPVGARVDAHIAHRRGSRRHLV